MITRWTKVSATEFTSTWRGKYLSLRWEGSCWRLYSDSAPVKDTWTSPQQAFEAIDRVQSRQLADMMAQQPVARQRQGSPHA